MPLTVSTICPSCGGGLEFEHGTNAVKCGFCGSSHVVTGHGRVLSYYITEKIVVNKAVSLALVALRDKGLPGCKVREATLFFVPFYHFIGQDFFWEMKKEVISEAEELHEQRSIFMAPVGGLDDGAFLDSLSGVGHGSPQLTEKRFEMDARHIDRTLPAADLPELGVFSLGLRPEVLKLSLFERKAVLERGQITPVKLPIAEVEERGYAPVRPDGIVFRRVFGKTRAVVYFPFWIVEVARPDGSGAVAVVDGVSGDVTNADAPLSILDRLVDRDGHEYATVGLRPLKCPDCGADLPVRPKDVVFFCDNCKKAWYIAGEELAQVSYSQAPPVNGQKDPLYLPFWVVEAGMRSGGQAVETKYDLSVIAPGLRLPSEADRKIPLRFFVPAFEMGNLGVLSRISSTFTKNQPVWQDAVERAVPAKGGFISPDDALEVAPVVLFSLIPKGNKKALKFALEATVEAKKAELVLVPFFKTQYDYVDGLFGLSLPAAAVKE